MWRAMHSRTWGAAALAMSLTAALGTAPARAQISPTTNGPIDITADTGDFSNQTCQSTWSGSAEALQGDSRLSANVIKAFLKRKPQAPGAKPPPPTGGLDTQSSCGATDRIEADGDVFYQTPTQMARGDHAVYTSDDAVIVMTGDVVVVQGKDVARGDRMVIHTQTRVAQMYSNATGRGTPGRVRAVLFPNQPAAGAPGAPGQAAPVPPPANVTSPAGDGGGGVQ